MKLAAYIGGLGVLGPGLANWPETAAVLAGRQVLSPGTRGAAAADDFAGCGAPAHRAGRQAGLGRSRCKRPPQAGEDPCHFGQCVLPRRAAMARIATNSATPCRSQTAKISPTRFANSVHNAAAGYWSIATGATVESQCAVRIRRELQRGPPRSADAGGGRSDRPCCWSPTTREYPQPMHDKRPIPDAFGVALVLTPQSVRFLAGENRRGAHRLEPRSAHDPALEALRCGVPRGARAAAAAPAGRAALRQRDSRVPGCISAGSANRTMS